MDDIKSLLTKLVRLQSITPQDAGCQQFMIQYLEQLGFTCTRFDYLPVRNFFARIGQQSPLLVFAGHSDVVPVGDSTKWLTDPFQLVEKEGILYGRGTADMKGSLVSMMVAASRFLQANPAMKGSLGFLITSGEEGDLYDQGTPFVMSALKDCGIHLDYCIVGEPSSTARLADVIKVGRRGSLTAKITIHGKQGHVAYPHLAINPIHTTSSVLAELTSTVWDQGNQHFPPTSMQITHLHAGGQANNIIPGELTIHLNFRYSTEQTAEGLQHKVEQCFLKYGVKPEIHWILSGKPFLTSQGKLLDCCIKSVKTITGMIPELSTSGGTSDGRFIAPYGVEVIELGPINATIHQVNECVSLEDLEQLSTIYLEICQNLLSSE